MLGAAQADALGAEARARVRRPAGCRRWRARRARAARRTSASTVCECSVDLGLDQRHVVGRDRAGGCRRSRSGRPRAGRVRRREPRRPRGRSSSSAAPVTAGRPMPRATSAAWRGLAALGGEDPRRRVEAGDVVGLGERAARGSRRAAARPAPTASAAREHDRALGRARARRPRRARAPRSGRSGRRSGAAARRATPASIVRDRRARGRAAPRRPRRRRSAPPPAPGAWRCASAACTGAPPRS